MISNTKRYKNEVEDAKKRVRENFTDTFFYLKTYVLFADSGMKLEFNAQVDCTKRFMQYENQDGVIYFGVDLKNCSFKYDTDQLVNDVNYAKIEWESPDIFHKDSIFKNSPHDFYALRSNRALLKDLPGFQKLKSMVQDVNNKGRAEVTLRDGQFPKLKNREMLPVAWLDFSKGFLCATTNNYTDSYRKDIISANLANKNDYLSRNIRACPRLLAIKFEP